MNHYQSHKIVEAGQIEQLFTRAGGVRLTLAGGEIVDLDDPIWSRIAAAAGETTGDVIGGYLVRYPDGYVSWSPADSFEQGYTELPQSEDGEAVVNLHTSIDGMGLGLRALIDNMVSLADMEGLSDRRWIAVAKTHFQQGLMCLRRSLDDDEEKW
jgi:hypothetical protein